MDKSNGLRAKIAKRIHMLRAERGWSQEVLGELTETHRNYIGHVERAEFTVGLENLEKIAASFDLSLTQFFDFDNYSCKKTLLNDSTRHTSI